MPLILSQHFSPADRVYADAEGSLYHYPQVYFKRVQPYELFIYYRPLGEAAQRHDSKTYFGHGVIGVPWPDPEKSDHRFAPIIRYEPFPSLVPLKDVHGNYYETGSKHSPQSQSAVRVIDQIGYHRILAAAGVAFVGVSQMPSTEAVAATGYLGRPIDFPKDVLREARVIPSGAGYTPHGERAIDVYESASLQERARADHQATLKLFAARAHKVNGTCWYNNNIDLFVDAAGQRLLVEAKSLTDPRQAIDRMRYGIGQLTDYRVRYRSETAGSLPVLAFGLPPDRASSWVASVLEEAGIGFVAAVDDKLEPLNDCARKIAILRK